VEQCAEEIIQLSRNPTSLNRRSHRALSIRAAGEHQGALRADPSRGASLRRRSEGGRVRLRGIVVYRARSGRKSHPRRDFGSRRYGREKRLRVTAEIRSPMGE